MDIVSFIQEQGRYHNCPFCGKRLTHCKVNLVGRVKNNYTVKVTCTNCFVTFVVVLVVNGLPEEVYEISDKVHNKKLGPITADELIDLHQMLSGLDKGFKELFQQVKSHRD